MTENEKIFNEIYDNTYKKVLIYVTAKCSNMYDIEDILQEVYTELYSVICRKGTTYIINKEGFVMKIAKRKIYLHYTLRERVRGISLSSEDENERELVEQISDDFELEDKICTADMIENINKLIFSKPLVTQKIFSLYYTFDMTISEIAELLAVSESYVKNKLYRTLNELRKQYGGEKQ